MVNYAYRNLFYKSQQTKDILIVDEMATVTPVTGTAPTVSNATVEIHTEDVKTNSFKLNVFQKKYLFTHSICNCCI